MIFRLGLLALGLAGWLTANAGAADDIEVLARGPVHEAYAEPSEREPTATPVIPKDPPKPIEELPPDQKPAGDNVQWMPGYWAWDDDKKDFLWVSGFWRVAPPGRTWVPGSWRKADGGWQWTGGFWAAAQENKAQVEYLPQPPAPLDDAGPATPAPSETQVYVPGCWVYRERYVWRPGYWTEYRPGWVWVAAHYRWTPAGYIFVGGYWDYPLVDRGVLFAPVYISPVAYAAPTFVYTPTYVVQENCLFGAFFCRRHFGCYYFGDYFAPSYATLGFTAWCGHVGVSIGVGGPAWYDPLFAYYRCGFRADPFWGGGGINNLYAGRYRGDYLRPPTTLVQQTTVISNITKNTTVTNNSNLNNVTMVQSLNNVAKSGRRNFQPVSEPARKQFAQTAAVTHQVGARRASTERELAARPGAGTRTAAPRTATLEVPQSLAAKSPLPKGGTPATAALPPRPTATHIAPPKTGLPARTDPRATLGSPKLDHVPDRVAGPSRINPKPPVAPRLPSVTPGSGSPSPVQPKVVPKSTPSKAGLPRTPSAITPKASSSVRRSHSAAAIKPPASRPPVSVPKPPSLPVAPRTLAPPRPPAVSTARSAPHLGPAASPASPTKKQKK